MVKERNGNDRWKWGIKNGGRGGRINSERYRDNRKRNNKEIVGYGLKNKGKSGIGNVGRCYNEISNRGRKESLDR